MLSWDIYAFWRTLWKKSRRRQKGLLFWWPRLFTPTYMKSKLFLVVLGAIFGLSLLVAKDRVLADELCPGGTCLGESVLDVYDYCKAHQSENWCVQYYARDTVTCGALTCRYSKFSLGPNVKCISEDISINPECDGTTFEMQAGSCCSNDPGGGSGGSCPAAAGVPGLPIPACRHQAAPEPWRRRPVGRTRPSSS